MFGVTRVAFEDFAWTCSQPIDWLDGYDLLTKAGKDMVKTVIWKHRPCLTVIAFDCRIWSILANMNPEQNWDALRQHFGKRMLKFVLWLAKTVDRAGRYYLIENPASSSAWTYEGHAATTDAVGWRCLCLWRSMPIWGQGRGNGPASEEARGMAIEQPDHLEPRLQAVPVPSWSPPASPWQ